MGGATVKKRREAISMKTRVPLGKREEVVTEKRLTRGSMEGN